MHSIDTSRFHRAASETTVEVDSGKSLGLPCSISWCCGVTLMWLVSHVEMITFWMHSVHVTMLLKLISLFLLF